MFKYVLTICFITLINFAIAQSPANLVGTWKGRYTRFNDRINPSLSMDYILTLSLEDGKLMGIVRYENCSDGSKDVTLRKINMGFINGNGYDILAFDHIEYTSKNQLQITGGTYFKVIMVNGKRLIAGAIKPDMYEKGNPRFEIELFNANDVVGLNAKEGSDNRIIYNTKESYNDSGSLGDGAKLLFKGINNKLNIRDQNTIFNLTSFMLSEDKKAFILDESSKEYPFSCNVYAIDLNSYGQYKPVLSMLPLIPNTKSTQKASILFLKTFAVNTEEMT